MSITSAPPGKRTIAHAARAVLAAEVESKGSVIAARSRGVDVTTLHAAIAGATVRRGTAALLEANEAGVTPPAPPAPPAPSPPSPDVLERLERLFGASGLTGEQVFERLEALIAKLDQLDVLLAASIERANAAKAA
jgi:hypothetical protein